MRYGIIAALLLVMVSCHRNNDPFLGRWTVEKVHVDFNEQIATPEMVRQYGELEKGNVIEITQDSIMTFVSGGDTLRGTCSLKGNQVMLDGKPFGRYEDGQIHTEISTPMGKIKVQYKKAPHRGAV